MRQNLTETQLQEIAIHGAETGVELALWTYSREGTWPTSLIAGSSRFRSFRADSFGVDTPTDSPEDVEDVLFKSYIWLRDQMRASNDDIDYLHIIVVAKAAQVPSSHPQHGQGSTHLHSLSELEGLRGDDGLPVPVDMAVITYNFGTLDDGTCGIVMPVITLIPKDGGGFNVGERFLSTIPTTGFVPRIMEAWVE